MIFPGDRRTTFEDPVIGAFAASVSGALRTSTGAISESFCRGLRHAG